MREEIVISYKLLTDEQTSTAANISPETMQYIRNSHAVTHAELINFTPNFDNPTETLNKILALKSQLIAFQSLINFFESYTNGQQ